MDTSLLVVTVVVTALAFDFTNGFHDTANAMATSIATGALRPKVAVGICAVLNLVGAFLSTQVAKTISSGLVDDAKITPAIVFGGLVGAIAWNLVTWLLGLPSSSSHALFGGLVGATWIAAGSSAVHFSAVVSKVILPAVVSPVICGVTAAIATFVAYRATARVRETAKTGFRHGQTVSASLVSLAHGTGDAQKTMGVITLVLIASGSLREGSGPPWWVILLAGAAIAAGTYSGGWRIIRTMGKGITDIESPQGFAAEASSTATLLTSAHLGFPLSTTQVVSGGILGAGIGRTLAEVRWGIAGRIAFAWLLTLPAAAVVGAFGGRIADTGTAGVVVIAVVAVALMAGAFALARRRPVTSDNVNDDTSIDLRGKQPAPAAA